MQQTNKNSNRNRLHHFILEKDHPCVMAQMVFQEEQFSYHEYPGFEHPSSIVSLLSDLQQYLRQYDFSSSSYYTFIASFPDEEIESEVGFESKMWSLLQQLHLEDDSEWDGSVDKDPESDSFSFSLCGKAFYIVGMHPKSSRKARQSPFPTLVFNLHHQFEKLRELNAYQATRDRIRERDKALQGHINPMLADFGHGNEAAQYSGRQVGKDWKCPFHHK